MKKLLKPMELLTQIANQTSKILQKLDDMESKKYICKTNDFNIDTFSKASKKLKCSISTLRTAIKNNILKIDIHYKYNGRKKYLFSNSALEDIKGTL
jgi:hypothetical protein